MSQLTQQQVNNAVDAIVSKNGQNKTRIGAPGVEVGQCPAPVVELVLSLGAPAPSMFGDRADGWGVEFPASLAPFLTHEAFQPGKVYPKGTILMFNSPHICMVLDSTGGNTASVYEQNADPDGSPCHTATRTLNASTHKATWALIWNVTSPVSPVPQPTTNKTVTLPWTTGPWHLYRQGGPYNPAIRANWLGLIEPGLLHEDLIYPVLAVLDNGNVVRIPSEDYGVGDLWIAGSDVVIK